MVRVGRPCWDREGISVTTSATAGDVNGHGETRRSVRRRTKKKQEKGAGRWRLTGGGCEEERLREGNHQKKGMCDIATPLTERGCKREAGQGPRGRETPFDRRGFQDDIHT